MQRSAPKPPPAYMTYAGIAGSAEEKSDVILVGSEEGSFVARLSTVVERCDIVDCVILSVDGGSPAVVAIGLTKGGPVVYYGKISICITDCM